MKQKELKGYKYDIKRGADLYRAIWGALLAKWISSGKIKAGEILVWRSGLSGWRKAEELEELAPLFQEQDKQLSKSAVAGSDMVPHLVEKNKIKNILLIDDEKDLCWLLTDILKKRGYNVKSANSRRAAMAFLKKDNHQDLVILDLKLPDGDGMNMIPRIKQICPKAIICIASAYGSIKNKEEAKQNGAFSFIDKPFSIEDIEKHIK